jgi:hypothetical protein
VALSLSCDRARTCGRAQEAGNLTVVSLLP